MKHPLIDIGQGDKRRTTLLVAPAPRMTRAGAIVALIAAATVGIGLLILIRGATP